MGLKTILWAGFFGMMCFAALGAPIWGIVGYVGHYSVGAERQWWEAPLSPLGLRYSFTLAAFTAAGIAINWGKLRFGRRLLSNPEKLMLAFLGLVWLMTLIMPETVGRYTISDHPSIKLTKVLVFVLMLTHVATTRRNLDIVLWAMVIGALILGMQAYDTPRRAFVSGRLDSVGGPDFSDANRLAGYMAAMLPIIGVMFMRSRLRGRIVCFLAAGFVANTIVLCRSRGAVVGLAAAGVVAIVMAPRRYRLKIALGVIVGAAGLLYLGDPQFLGRAGTITAEEGERDPAAQSRIEIWRGSIKMLAAHPLGVGPGNFYQSIGSYAPGHAGRDAHNTFVRCWGELGIPGILLFLALLATVVATIRRILRQSHALPEEDRRQVYWTATGLAAGIAGAFGYALTGTILYTEYAWWMLALPICLERVVANLKEDLTGLEEDQAMPEPNDLYEGVLVA